MREKIKELITASIRNIIGVITVIGCFVLLYFLMIKGVPAENKDTLNIAVGFVFGSLGAVMSYYFGSSKSEVDSKKAQNEKI